MCACLAGPDWTFLMLRVVRSRRLNLSLFSMSLRFFPRQFLSRHALYPCMRDAGQKGKLAADYADYADWEQENGSVLSLIRVIRVIRG